MDPLLLTKIPNSTIGFSFIVGLFASILLVPSLMRVVGSLGFLDQPNPRKIHEHAIPRVGGIAIAVGVLLPTLLWAREDTWLSGCLLGALVIVIGGMWDDFKSLSQLKKAVFQLIAIAIVIYSGIRIEHVPFFGLDPVPEWVSYPLTVLFLMGITNATNLFDGLDGLAGGCVLLSLGMIAAFSYGAGGNVITLVALATIGATLGFLRFNTYPASVFMGDSGSQLLGFTAAVLSILLIEKTHAGLNFGIPLLILGLPILDTAMVIALRLKSGHSPFRPDNRHLHHQLLKLGVNHASAVAILYLIQALMVFAAYVLRYQSDIVVVSTFLGISALVLGAIYVARITGFQATGRWSRAGGADEKWVVRFTPLMQATRVYVEYSIAALFVTISLIFAEISYDIAIFALVLAGALVFAFFVMRAWAVFFSRLGIYTVALLTVFSCYSLANTHVVTELYFKIFLLSLMVCIAIIILFDTEQKFQITPLDLLIFILAITIPAFSSERSLDFPIIKQAVSAGIIIYACECVISAAPSRHRVLKISALLSLILLGTKAII